MIFSRSSAVIVVCKSVEGRAWRLVDQLLGDGSFLLAVDGGNVNGSGRATVSQIDFYSLHTTCSYSITVAKSGSVTCPSCGVTFEKRGEVMNHIAGMKHQSMVDHAQNVSLPYPDVCVPPTAIVL